MTKNQSPFRTILARKVSDRLSRHSRRARRAGRFVESMEDRCLLAATVTGTVWHDDGDGIRATGEFGLEYAVAQLIDIGTDGVAGSNDDVQVGAAVTDLAGDYSFDVPAGTYYVQFRALPGFTFSATGAGDSDSDAGHEGKTATFGLADDGVARLDAGLTGERPEFGWAFGVGEPGCLSDCTTDAYTPVDIISCLLYTSPSPRDKRQSRMPSSA